MSNVFDLQGSVKLNHREVLDGLAKVDKQVDETGNSMEKLEGKSGKVGKVMGGLGKTIASAFSLNVIKNFAKEAVEGANVQIMAETKLQNNLMATGKATMENVESLKQYASHLQEVGVIGDEVGMAGMSQLATFNLTSDSIKTLSDGMYNLAVNQKGVSATQEDMMGYANMVGKAMQGQATALTRVGVTMDEHQKKIIETGTEQERAAVIAEVLKANYGNLNEEIAKTPEGKMQQLKNDLGDMKETLGTALLPVITKVVEGIQKLVDWFTSLSPGMQKVILVGGLIVAFLPGLIGLLSGLATIAGACGISFTAMSLPILAIIAVIAAVIAIGVLLWKNWDKIKEKCAELGQAISKKWEAIKTAVSEKVEAMKTAVSNKFQSVKDDAIGKFNALKEGLLKPINWAKDKIKTAIEGIKSFFKFEWSLPKIKLPHFNMTGKFSLLPPSIPKFNVDWYSSGGIFNKKTVLPNGIGVGDANKGQGSNPEAIMPIDGLRDMIKDLLQVTIPLNINGREFVRTVVAPHQEEFDKYNTRNPKLSY